MTGGAASQRIELDDAPHTQMALARTNLMAGCLQAVLDLGLQFAAERIALKTEIFVLDPFRVIFRFCGKWAAPCCSASTGTCGVLLLRLGEPLGGNWGNPWGRAAATAY